MAGTKKSGTPKAELLRLDGTQIDKHGNESHTDFFTFLDLPKQHNADLSTTMTPSQAIKFRNHIVKMRVGTSAAMPMLCGGESRCPVKTCPFHEEKNWPLAKQCPIESLLISDWFKSYVEELDVNPSNRAEMVLINKLVECDLIDYRANSFLGVDEESWSLLKVNVTSTEQMTSENTVVHPILEAKEKVHKIRMNILESLTATRRESYKRAAALKKGDDDNLTSHMMKIKNMMSKASKIPSIETIKEDARKISEVDIEDAEWKTIGE